MPPKEDDESIDTRSFLDDLDLTLEDSQRDIVAEALKKSGDYYRITPKNIELHAAEIVEITGCSLQTASSVLRCVIFLAIRLVSQDSEIHDVALIIEELKELAPDLTAEQEKRLTHLLPLIVARTETIEKSFSNRGFLPMFEDLDATIELRSNHSPFEIGKTGTVEEISFTPIASIRLTLDSGTPDEICFQATQQDLEDLQTKVALLLTNLSSLENLKMANHERHDQ